MQQLRPPSRFLAMVADNPGETIPPRDPSGHAISGPLAIKGITAVGRIRRKNMRNTTLSTPAKNNPRHATPMIHP